MAHDHAHHHHAPASYDRAFAIGIALNLAYVVVEAVFGFVAGSLALLADAGHNLSDVLGLALAWGAAWLARRQPTPRRTYGLRRSSILAALANAMLLLVAIGAIAWEAVHRLQTPEPVATGIVLWVAAVGVLVNGGTALMFMRGRESDLNALTCALAIFAAEIALPAQASQPRSKARLFAPQDLGLLEAPDRDQWQKPEQIMDSLLIAEGSVVADLGAGGGWFTARLSARVGPNGLVYAEDIQPAMIEVIERRKTRENLRNVRTVLGTANDPRLPSGINAALIVDAYHEMEIPPADPIVLLRRVAESLRPDGRVGVVDFNPGGGGPGPEPDERVDPEAVIRAAAAAGLRLIAREPQANQFQFLLVFGKATPPPVASP